MGEKSVEPWKGKKYFLEEEEDEKNSLSWSGYGFVMVWSGRSVTREERSVGQEEEYGLVWLGSVWSG